MHSLRLSGETARTHNEGFKVRLLNYYGGDVAEIFPYR